MQCFLWLLFPLCSIVLRQPWNIVINNTMMPSLWIRLSLKNLWMSGFTLEMGLLALFWLVVFTLKLYTKLFTLKLYTTLMFGEATGHLESLWFISLLFLSDWYCVFRYFVYILLLLFCLHLKQKPPWSTLLQDWKVEVVIYRNFYFLATQFGLYPFQNLAGSVTLCFAWLHANHPGIFTKLAPGAQKIM